MSIDQELMKQTLDNVPPYLEHNHYVTDDAKILDKLEALLPECLDSLKIDKVIKYPTALVLNSFQDGVHCLYINLFKNTGQHALPEKQKYVVEFQRLTGDIFLIQEWRNILMS